MRNNNQLEAEKKPNPTHPDAARFTEQRRPTSHATHHNSQLEANCKAIAAHKVHSMLHTAKETNSAHKARRQMQTKYHARRA